LTAPNPARHYSKIMQVSACSGGNLISAAYG